MNKSLEALDELSLMINREKHINSEWNKKINDLKQTIKQDLERKEQLEKRNKELVNIIDELREENFKIKQFQVNIMGEQDNVRQKQFETLIKENQKLKEELERTETARILLHNELKCCVGLNEYVQKLKKVINFLKHNFDIKLDSKLRISDEIECVQTFLFDMETNEVVYDDVKEVLIDEL